MLTRPLGKPPEELNFKITRAYSAPLTTKKQKTTYERSLNYTLRKTYDLLLNNGIKKSMKSHLKYFS